MIKALILGHLAEAVRHAAPELNNLTVDEALLSGFRLERPRNAEHGDYAVNVSFLARPTKMPPPAIATCLIKALTEQLANTGHLFSVQPLGGYLNFTVSETALLDSLAGLIQAEKPGANASQQAERILLEYVSANPTGPLHIGHGRWAALGDSLVRILRHCGAEVTAEFYINDFGFQMEKMALSLWWRSVECLKDDGKLSGVKPEHNVLESRELPYSGEFVVDLARELLVNPEFENAILQDWVKADAKNVLASGDITDTDEWHDAIKGRLIAVAVPILLGGQKKLLEAMRVHFDVWTSEKEAMHLSGAVAKTLATLEKTGHTYEEDGALWFRSEAIGDEKNRVLRKQDGSYTYLTADIAYHHEKFTRTSTASGKPYTHILNIWGADHHGYIARLRGAVQALGHNPDQFEVLLGQLVNLVIDGERTRMGKRRKMLTLQDVVDEVGVDATRFWMVSKSADSTLDFDVDLASSSSSDNPVFYVQYAHARCCSILRNATEPAVNIETGETQPAAIDPEDLEKSTSALSIESIKVLFDSLPAESPESRERAVLKALIMRLDSFEEMVRDAARMRAPHFLTQYMMDLAAQFHSFYNVCRIITADKDITRSRLLLILAIRKVLAQALDLLGVHAPEKM